jgi:hypothetical protein
MASEMQERVARAIYEGRNGRGCAPWGRLPGSHKAPYLADALAAMEAMRGPTKDIDARLREFGFAFVETDRIESFGERVKARSDLATEYAAMLNAEIEAAKQP